MGIRTQSFDMLNSNIDSEGGKYRFMPRQIASRTYRNNMIFYQEILTRDDLASSVEKIKASCIKISACQDNQFAADGASNGLFTAKLIEVWKEGQFKGGYRKFHKTIVHKMPPVQTANYYTFGKNDSTIRTSDSFYHLGFVRSLGLDARKQILCKKACSPIVEPSIPIKTKNERSLVE